MASRSVKVGDQKLSLSNVDKVLYPETGFTKGQVIDFYSRVAPSILPHIENRPITLKRYPNGIKGEHFYEKKRSIFHAGLDKDVPDSAQLARIDDQLHPDQRPADVGMVGKFG